VPTLEWTQDLPVSQQQLWDFHADPATALPRLTPPGFAVKLVHIDEPYGKGAELEMRTRAFPLVWQRWVARIVEFDPPHGFVDIAERSPFASWRHEHIFEARGPQQSRLIDRVTYTAPFGPLGRMFDPLLIRPRLQAMFAHRHRVTAEDLAKK